MDRGTSGEREGLFLLSSFYLLLSAEETVLDQREVCLGVVDRPQDVESRIVILTH